MLPLVAKSDVVNSLVEIGDHAVCDLVIDAALISANNGVALHRIFKGLDGYDATAKANAFVAGPGANLQPATKAQILQAAANWDAINASAAAHQMRAAVEQAAAELGLAL